MNTHLRLAVVASILAVGGRAVAEAPAIAAQASTRAARPISVTVVATATGLGLPLVGVQAEYQLTDRLALGAELSTLLFVGGASANARYFVAAAPTSGLFVELAGRTFGGMVRANGGSAELGYQLRDRGGALLEITGGLWVLDVDDCGCGPPPSVPRQSPRHAYAAGSLRFGHAF